MREGWQVVGPGRWALGARAQAAACKPKTKPRVGQIHHATTGRPVVQAARPVRCMMSSTITPRASPPDRSNTGHLRVKGHNVDVAHGPLEGVRRAAFLRPQNVEVGQAVDAFEAVLLLVRPARVLGLEALPTRAQELRWQIQVAFVFLAKVGDGVRTACKAFLFIRCGRGRLACLRATDRQPQRCAPLVVSVSRASTHTWLK